MNLSSKGEVTCSSSSAEAWTRSTYAPSSSSQTVTEGAPGSTTQYDGVPAVR